jgi:hypothetical protein
VTNISRDCTRPDLLELTSCEAPDHRHTDDAHNRHEQSGVPVSFDDESPCNGRHFEVTVNNWAGLTPTQFESLSSSVSGC